MTDAQNEALEQVKRLMREHFDSAVFIFESEDPSTSQGWDTNYTTSGGSFSSSIGLVRYAEHRMLNPETEEEEET